MMSEKQFRIERDSAKAFTFFYNGKHRMYDEEVVNLLNEQIVEIQKLTREKNCYKGRIKQKNDKIERLQRENKKLQVHYKYDVKHLKEKNEQLRKQIQNYEQLISNSYVGEEETLDGFVGKYVIWEDELQKYKNKNEMIDDG